MAEDGNSKVANYVASNLEHEDSAAVWESAKALEVLLLGAYDRLQHLLTARERPVATRTAAAYVIGFSRISVAREALEAVLADETDVADVRGHAAEALGYIGAEESVGMLAGRLDDANPEVRYWCAFALGQIGDERALPALERMAAVDDGTTPSGQSLRLEAKEAIAAIARRCA